MSEASVIGKIVAKGTLKLESPLIIASGMSEDKNEIDTHVLKNKDGRPYIPGTSLAGVLRDFCRRENPDLYEMLFGSENSDAKNAMQSSLVFSDIILQNAEIASRDGVSIDSLTGIAKKHHKFDFEAVERGATGNFKMVVTLRKKHREKQEEISALLDKLLRKIAGGFLLGGWTAKGMGKARVENLVENVYDFRLKEDVAAWLSADDRRNAAKTVKIEGGKAPYISEDFVVEASFHLLHSLIVRDYSFEEQARASGDEGRNIAATSMRSREDYLIPGSSVKGVLRHRLEYIFAMMGKDTGLIMELMGRPSEVSSENHRIEQKGKKSRFYVNEVYIPKNTVKTAAQTRIRVDRFTGGTIGTALFSTQPMWGTDETRIRISFSIRNAKKHEAGMALCLLKDLWTGRVAIGGEKSIGRGVLEGLAASIHYKGITYEWKKDERLKPEKARELQDFVNAFAAYDGTEGKSEEGGETA